MRNVTKQNHVVYLLKGAKDRHGNSYILGGDSLYRKCFSIYHWIEIIHYIKFIKAEITSRKISPQGISSNMITDRIFGRDNLFS
jgi:hypothetical protein